MSAGTIHEVRDIVVRQGRLSSRNRDLRLRVLTTENGQIYVAGGVVTITRASWIEAVGVGNQSAAWEIYPVKPQLTTYVVPFGENLGFADFNRVFVLIQATADNTTVTVDVNQDGAAESIDWNRDGTADGTSRTLARGETILLDRISAYPGSTTTPLPTGVVIQGSQTLQVKFVAGNPGQTYSARGLRAFPRGFWTKDYYATLDQPTGGGVGSTDYYLHNPNAAAITVNRRPPKKFGRYNPLERLQ